MIRLDCEQGSLTWIQARLGLPTASQFSRILTPKTAKLSTSADGYVYELLAEQLLGHSLDDTTSLFMERGTALEGSAVAYYEFQKDMETEKVGFILRDDRKVGCSPDRLVGGVGGLEIKCASAAVHVGYMVSGGVDDKYRCQIQGNMWLTEREWWDVLAFNPELPSVVIRVERDDIFIGQLAKAVDQFISYLEESREKLEAGGFVRAAPELVAV